MDTPLRGLGGLTLAAFLSLIFGIPLAGLLILTEFKSSRLYPFATPCLMVLLAIMICFMLLIMR